MTTLSKGHVVEAHNKELLFYFDYSSPFSYLGSTQVERVAREHGADVVWKPFLLGALFRKIGTPMVPIAAMSEPKRAHVMLDLERWAKHWNVPFRYATRFPLRTVKALRLTLLADSVHVPRLVDRIYRLCWQDDGDPEDDAMLEQCLRDVGLPISLIGRTREEGAKQALMSATDEAITRQLPGAPCFVINDLVFWGQDRLVFVEKALSGWRPRSE